LVLSLLVLTYFVSKAGIVTCPTGIGMDKVHDGRFEAEAAKVSGPAKNSFLSPPMGRVYPSRAPEQENGQSGCRVAARNIPHTLMLPG
jgi:hypothetical protein